MKLLAAVLCLIGGPMVAWAAGGLLKDYLSVRTRLAVARWSFLLAALVGVVGVVVVARSVLDELSRVRVEELQRREEIRESFRRMDAALGEMLLREEVPKE